MKRNDGQGGPRLAPAIVEDKAIEKLKKRAQDLGLIVNAGVGRVAAQAPKKKGGAGKKEERH
jgi:hypothetical protein